MIIIYSKYNSIWYWINGETLNYSLKKLREIITDFEKTGKDNLILSEEILFMQNFKNTFTSNDLALDFWKFIK